MPSSLSFLRSFTLLRLFIVSCVSSGVNLSATLPPVLYEVVLFGLFANRAFEPIVPIMNAKRAKGDRGLQGIPGPPGPAGVTGRTGATGATGAKGTHGDKGARGLTGSIGKESKGQIGGRIKALDGVAEHIDQIYVELENQVARMKELQRQLDDLRAKIRMI